MDTSLPSYERPLTPGNDPDSDIAYWHEAIDAYNLADYRQSLFAVINYINPSVLENQNLENDVEFTAHHGSAVIRIKITGKQFAISDPFLKISHANRVAILRRVAEINFFPLNLCQIILDNDSLCFHFITDIDLCHPLKIYDVIHEICISADDHDDEFIRKYRAEYYETPHICQLANEQQERVWNRFKTISEQYKKYMLYFEQNLWVGSMWDIMAISMLNLATMPYVHGTLRTELDEALSVHFDMDLDADYRLDRGKSFLKSLLFETDREDFMANIYLADTFISLKSRSSNDILMSIFKQARDSIAKEVNEGNDMAAAYTMMVFFMRLLYDFNLDSTHRDIIFSALEQAGGKDCKQASPLLWKTYEDFVNGRIKPVKHKNMIQRLHEWLRS